MNDNHECPTAERHRIADDASGREDYNSSIRFSDEADNPWIKATNLDVHFSSNVKKNSEHKGRYFQKEWFQHHKLLWYHREKKAAFCGVCTLLQQPHDPSPFVFSGTADGFKNWKKGKEDKKNTNVAKTIEMLQKNKKCNNLI